MLGVPEVLNFYFKRIFPHPAHRAPVGAAGGEADDRHAAPVATTCFGAVKALFDELEGMAPLLQDPLRSSIRIVLNPERMVINESQRLYTYLNLFGFPVDAVIANRVLPPRGAFGVLRPLVRDPGRPPGGGAPVLRAAPVLPGAPVRPRDGRAGPPRRDGARGLRRRAIPPACSSQERPIEVKKEGKGYAMYIRLPFAEKDRIQVWTKGEELVVSVDNQRRHILLPRTPGVAPADGCRVQGAALACRVRGKGDAMAD